MTGKLTKAEIAERVHQIVGSYSKAEIADFVGQVFDQMKRALGDGDTVSISGFGVFTVREKAPRLGRNPKTGRGIEITARRVVTFKPSKILRAALGGRAED